MVTLSKKLICVCLGALLLASCSSREPDISPADVQPVYKIRNSPIPVPAPKWKPQRRRAAQAQVPARKSQAVPRSNSSRTKPVSTAPRSTSSVQPPARSHTVRKGQTLYGIAKQYGVPVRSVISANSLRAPYALAVGQRINIPTSKLHTVAKGDTGYSISRRYGVTVSALMRANSIRAPFRLTVGQKLNLPGGAKVVGANSAPRRRPAVSKPASRGRIIARPTPPPRSKSGFVWPVRGDLASRFGPKEGGLHNDGINIIAKQGTAVKSADAGVVVYASNALEGYGNLLLIKHRGGWMTAYAHNERILVQLNQQVKRGELVARVGKSGDVKEAQLHFEIRRGRQALDPLKYLNRR